MSNFKLIRLDTYKRTIALELDIFNSNWNGLIFTEKVMQYAIDLLRDKIDNRRFFCPIYKPNGQKISVLDISHLVTDLRIIDHKLRVEIEILTTDSGYLLSNLFNDYFAGRIDIDISFSGVGTCEHCDEPGRHGCFVNEGFEIKYLYFKEK